jgi:uncharacterized membrane protein YphA (DoxX/SURF4 family)
MLRHFLRHAAGIGHLCFTVALLYAAYVFQTHGWAFVLTVAAFVPGYFTLRYLRAVFGRRARR